MTDNHLKFSQAFEGHTLALASIGLLRYGKLINWDQNDLLDKVNQAVVAAGDIHLFAILNQSKALEAGIKHLASMNEDEGKDHFYEVVTMTVGALLQEWGGITGMRHMDRTAHEHALGSAMKALHGNNVEMRPLDSFTNQKLEQEVNEAAIEAKLGDTVPADLTDTLKAIGERTEAQPTQADQDTAERLRKHGKLN